MSGIERLQTIAEARGGVVGVWENYVRQELRNFSYSLSKKDKTGTVTGVIKVDTNSIYTRDTLSRAINRNGKFLIAGIYFEGEVTDTTIPVEEAVSRAIAWEGYRATNPIENALLSKLPKLEKFPQPSIFKKIFLVTLRMEDYGKIQTNKKLSALLVIDLTDIEKLNYYPSGMSESYLTEARGGVKEAWLNTIRESFKSYSVPLKHKSSVGYSWKGVVKADLESTRLYKGSYVLVDLYFEGDVGEGGKYLKEDVLKEQIALISEGDIRKAISNFPWIAALLRPGQGVSKLYPINIFRHKHSLAVSKNPSAIGGAAINTAYAIDNNIFPPTTNESFSPVLYEAKGGTLEAWGKFLTERLENFTIPFVLNRGRGVEYQAKGAYVCKNTEITTLQEGGHSLVKIPFIFEGNIETGKGSTVEDFYADVLWRGPNICDRLLLTDTYQLLLKHPELAGGSGNKFYRRGGDILFEEVQDGQHIFYVLWDVTKAVSSNIYPPKLMEDKLEEARGGVREAWVQYYTKAFLGYKIPINYLTRLTYGGEYFSIIGEIEVTKVVDFEDEIFLISNFTKETKKVDGEGEEYPLEKDDASIITLPKVFSYISKEMSKNPAMKTVNKKLNVATRVSDSTINIKYFIENNIYPPGMNESVALQEARGGVMEAWVQFITNLYKKAAPIPYSKVGGAVTRGRFVFDHCQQMDDGSIGVFLRWEGEIRDVNGDVVTHLELEDFQVAFSIQKIEREILRRIDHDATNIILPFSIYQWREGEQFRNDAKFQGLWLDFFNIWRYIEDNTFPRTSQHEALTSLLNEAKGGVGEAWVQYLSSLPEIRQWEYDITSIAKLEKSPGNTEYLNVKGKVCVRSVTAIKNSQGEDVLHFHIGVKHAICRNIDNEEFPLDDDIAYQAINNSYQTEIWTGDFKKLKIIRSLRRKTQEGIQVSRVKNGAGYSAYFFININELTLQNTFPPVKESFQLSEVRGGPAEAWRSYSQQVLEGWSSGEFSISYKFMGKDAITATGEFVLEDSRKVKVTTVGSYVFYEFPLVWKGNINISDIMRNGESDTEVLFRWLDKNVLIKLSKALFKSPAYKKIDAVLKTADIYGISDILYMSWEIDKGKPVVCLCLHLKEVLNQNVYPPGITENAILQEARGGVLEAWKTVLEKTVADAKWEYSIHRNTFGNRSYIPLFMREIASGVVTVDGVEVLGDALYLRLKVQVFNYGGKEIELTTEEQETVVYSLSGPHLLRNLRKTIPLLNKRVFHWHNGAGVLHHMLLRITDAGFVDLNIYPPGMNEEVLLEARGGAAEAWEKALKKVFDNWTVKNVRINVINHSSKRLVEGNLDIFTDISRAKLLQGKLIIPLKWEERVEIGTLLRNAGVSKDQLIWMYGERTIRKTIRDSVEKIIFIINQATQDTADIRWETGTTDDKTPYIAINLEKALQNNIYPPSE